MIIHRAFIKEILKTCSAVTAILFSIFLVIRLVGFLREAAEGDIPIDSVLLLLALKMITYLDILIPLVLYVSTLLVIGRWVRDSELTVITACGISMREFVRPAMVLAAIVGSIVMAFSLYLSPLSAEIGREMEHRFHNEVDISGLIPGVFTETDGGNGVYFIEQNDRTTDTLQGIFVSNDHHQNTDILVADSGHKRVDSNTDDEFLVLNNGVQYRVNAESGEYEVTHFESYALRLKQRAQNHYRVPIKARSTLTLLRDNHRASIGEFHWRLAKIVMLPILMLYALSFSSISNRKKRIPSMAIALLIYFAYSNVLGFCLALITRGTADPHVTLWIVHGLFLILAMHLFHQRCENRSLFPRFR